MTAELALTKPDPTLDEMSLRVLMAAADRYVKSGLLPAEVNTPQKALVIMQAGKEIGVPATYALRNIHVVKGKVTCSSELMLALVRRTYGPSAMRVGKSTNESCTIQYREQGWDGVSEYTFSMEDARLAGLVGSGPWKMYPAAMLRARAISAVVRFAFPEAIAGLYHPEELGAEVEVDQQGEVRYVSAEPTPLDEARARAMVGDTMPPEVASGLRDQAIARCAELAAYAELTEHPRASDIAAKNPQALNDQDLRTWVEWLERQFPGVTTDDVMALEEG